MEEKNLFPSIINQNHILKTILDYLPIKDSCNLSLTCKNCLEMTRKIKKEGLTYYWNGHVLFCSVDSETEIETSEIYPSDDFYIDYPYDLREMRKLKIIIFLRKALVSPEVMKSIGQRLNEILKVNFNIQQLSFHFTNPSDAFFAQYLVKEIKNSNIKELEIYILYNFWTITTDDNIFENMVNLKRVRISLQNSFITGIDRKLIDAISLIRDVTLEVYFNNVNINFDTTDISLQNMDNILSYVLSKNINLSITGSYYKLLNLNMFLRNFTLLNFNSLHGLRFDVTSIKTLHELGNYLPFMVNLKWLGIYFDIDNFDPNVNKNNAVYYYKSFKHLNGLKVIKIIFECKKKHNEEDNDIITLEENEKYKKCCQNELFYLLKNAPDTVENLYISEMSELTSKMTHLLNDYFPKLNLLFLKKVPKCEEECLKNFKNLKIYVCHVMSEIKLPKSIKICMICTNYDLPYGDIQRTFIKSVKCTDSENKIFDYYRSLNQFKKEYTLNGILKGKIFLNYFHDYYTIINYFDDILDLF
uniref:F-box domain-containing protein n=1 Tax=Strongyloides venezuelensis TaxID=75913 RepID=A0A0K0FNI7_STRVS